MGGSLVFTGFSIILIPFFMICLLISMISSTSSNFSSKSSYLDEYLNKWKTSAHRLSPARIDGPQAFFDIKCPIDKGVKKIHAYDYYEAKEVVIVPPGEKTGTFFGLVTFLIENEYKKCVFPLTTRLMMEHILEFLTSAPSLYRYYEDDIYSAFKDIDKMRTSDVKDSLSRITLQNNFTVLFDFYNTGPSNQNLLLYFEIEDVNSVIYKSEIFWYFRSWNDSIATVNHFDMPSDMPRFLTMIILLVATIGVLCFGFYVYRDGKRRNIIGTAPKKHKNLRMKFLA